MGIHRQMPDQLRQLHPKYGTPWVGILVFGVVACLALIPGQAEFLGNMYAFGAMLSFTIAHVALIVLRIRQPDVVRPYRGPGNIRIRGHDLPPTAIIGGLGTGTAFVVVTVLNPEVAIAGLLWLIIGVAVYVAYRRNQALDLTTTVKVALPRPVTEAEAEYDSILVALEVRPDYDPEALATAVRLAARRRRGIYVMVLITVPASSPIDAAMPVQEAQARAIVDQARLQGGRRVSGRWEKVRAGQAGRAIVDEARLMRARAIVMPLPPRSTGSSVFGKTLETVLAERPCRVIIESAPQSQPHLPVG
jgi:APA family basic amino acid/polyamine antiporter